MAYGVAGVKLKNEQLLDRRGSRYRNYVLCDRKDSSGYMPYSKNMEVIPARMVITSKCCKADIRLYVTNPCGLCAARKVHVMGDHDMQTVCVKCHQVAVMRSAYPTQGKFQ